MKSKFKHSVFGVCLVSQVGMIPVYADKQRAFLDSDVLPEVYSEVAMKELSEEKVTLKGVVVDASGEPLIGVNIKEKGTENGAITDLNGEFSLTVSGADAVLQFSYVGYVSKEVPAGRSSSMRIVLEEDTKTLGEVVVVGYGTQKKVNLTGSVSVASPEDIKARPISSVSNGLQGLFYP